MFEQLISFSRWATVVKPEPNGVAGASAHFKKAAEVFKYMRDQPWVVALHKECPDFSAPVLSFLSDLMLAQAQACFFEKAVNAKMSPQLGSSKLLCPPKDNPPDLCFDVHSLILSASPRS